MAKEILSVSKVVCDRVFTEEGRQGSRSNTRSVHIADEQEMLSSAEPARNCQRTMDDWLLDIMKDGDETATKKSKMRPQIQRVPSRLQGVHEYKKCFDPVVASIGPYHHGKPEFEAMEKLKTSSAWQFVSGCDQKIEVFYSKILEVAGEARECYADGSTAEFNDEAFTRIMFLDGCFVLHFIYCVMKEVRNELTTNSYNAAFLMRDLFLLENQLPYLVLQALMDLRFPGEQDKYMINQFINYQISSQDSPKPSSTAVGDQKPLHLLELLRTKLIGDCLTASLAKSINSNWHSFRSVKELKAVGINFKRSHTCCLKDVQFQSYKIYGELSLPPIAVDDSTKSKFLNLMAYELCPDASHDYSVTSYICFLDSLIDSADDVKELRSKGILLNFLGSDDQVADLFNQLADEMVPDPQAYYDVKGGIEYHYKSKMKVTMVEFLTTHFRSPWTSFAFLAATLVIILTFIQTVFTVFPR